MSPTITNSAGAGDSVSFQLVGAADVGSAPGSSPCRLSVSPGRARPLSVAELGLERRAEALDSEFMGGRAAACGLDAEADVGTISWSSICRAFSANAPPAQVTVYNSAVLSRPWHGDQQLSARTMGF